MRKAGLHRSIWPPARRSRAVRAPKLPPIPARESALLRLAGGNVDVISGHMVGEAFSAGDPLAREILMETVDLLGIWLSNVVDLLEPDVLIIGGGASLLLRPLFGDIHRRLCEFSIIQRCREIPSASRVLWRGSRHCRCRRVVRWPPAPLLNFLRPPDGYARTAPISACAALKPRSTMLLGDFTRSSRDKYTLLPIVLEQALS